MRRPSAVTDRTRELLGDAQRRTPGLRDLVLETWLTVTTQPGHLLNAHTLHETLKEMPMPDRDVAWSLPTYYTLDDGGPLDRLIRWASRSQRPGLPQRCRGTRRDHTGLDVHVTEPDIARPRDQSSVSTPLGAPVSAAKPYSKICRGERSLRDRTSGSRLPRCCALWRHSRSPGRSPRCRGTENGLFSPTTNRLTSSPVMPFAASTSGAFITAGLMSRCILS